MLGAGAGDGNDLMVHLQSNSTKDLQLVQFTGYGWHDCKDFKNINGISISLHVKSSSDSHISIGDTQRLMNIVPIEDGDFVLHEGPSKFGDYGIGY